MAFDQAAWWAQNFPTVNYAEEQGTTNSAATAPMMPAPTVAPAPAYTGTNYATQLQNTLGGMQNQYASGGAGTHFAFNPAFYLAKNPDVARAVQSGMFTSPLQHWQMFGQNEGRAANAVQNMLHGSAPASMNYGTTLNNFGAGRAPPTFGSQPMPNQYQRAQTTAPTSWQGMMGSPFTGGYNNMATMPMLSALQNSPYASLFGMVPQAQTGMVTPPAAPQSFQIANGTTVSGTPQKAFGGMSKTDFIRNGPNAYREMKRQPLMKLQDRMKMQQQAALDAQRVARRPGMLGPQSGMLNRNMQTRPTLQPGPSPYSLQQQRPWLFD